MGQCCGGQVDLLFEVVGEGDRPAITAFAEREAAGPFVTAGTLTDSGVDRRLADEAMLPAGSASWSAGRLLEGFGEERRPLLLFGAGHVGRALVLALAPLPFMVEWIDPRDDAFPAYVPANVKLSRLSDPSAAVAGAARADTFVLIMTHSHQLDLALVAAALADDRFPYVGVIGSKSKRARFTRRLAEAGIPPHAHHRAGVPDRRAGHRVEGARRDRRRHGRGDAHPRRSLACGGERTRRSASPTALPWSGCEAWWRKRE